MSTYFLTHSASIKAVTGPADIEINFLGRKYMSSDISTMLPKGLYSKILKIFGVEKGESPPFSVKTSPFLDNFKVSKFK